MNCVPEYFLFLFVFNDAATTEIYTYLHTLSLHDALPIVVERHGGGLPLADHRRQQRRDDIDESTDRVGGVGQRHATDPQQRVAVWLDRKSTRLNSSH